ncbi:MAG: hypothetical protein E8D48_03225 [Nitrospira sp.]|nr:MAG: hypothetical protein E8D48_03225 [Nitrospira sp.]
MNLLLDTHVFLWFVIQSPRLSKTIYHQIETTPVVYISAASLWEWHTTTFVAGLRHDDISAPMVADGAMTGALFVKYVQEFLCPTLHPGDLVIADNLRSHKVAGVKEAVEAVGAHLRYLPPYSPDLNPIEKLFAKLKALLRKVAPRTVDALWTDIGRLLDDFTPDECTRYFASSGYVKT